MPLGAFAAPGDPQDGPSGPTASSYGNSEQYGNQQYGNQQYSYNEHEGYGEDEHDEYGNAGYKEEYGKEEYGNSASCESIHKIVLGENLTTIAKAYGVSLEALIEENGIEDANLIVENQALCIPAADHESYGERGSYGEESYGPSNGESYGPSDGQSEGHSNEPYMVPGVGYDPSTFKKEGGQEYGNQEYGNQETSNQGYGEPESDVYHVPGKGYDPNESYEPQRQPQYNSPERDEPFDFDDDNPDEGSDPEDEPEVPMEPDNEPEPG